MVLSLTGKQRVLGVGGLGDGQAGARAGHGVERQVCTGDSE